jgi:hypothetical protein
LPGCIRSFYGRLIFRPEATVLVVTASWIKQASIVYTTVVYTSVVIHQTLFLHLKKLLVQHKADHARGLRYVYLPGISYTGCERAGRRSF